VSTTQDRNVFHSIKQKLHTEAECIGTSEIELFRLLLKYFILLNLPQSKPGNCGALLCQHNSVNPSTLLDSNILIK
jgi:hypothetical protein